MLAAIILALFAGLRFEVGYDWLSYERLLKGVGGFGIAYCDERGDLPFLAEPIYVAINMAVNSAGAGFAVLLFAVAVFNLTTIYLVISRVGNAHPVVWVVYFGVAFLIAQMGAIRQGLASSFILIALLMAVEARPVKAILSAIMALGIHVSSAIFLPLLFLRDWRPDWRLALAFLAVGLTVALLGVEIHRPLLALISAAGPDWLSAKLSFYRNSPGTPISNATAGLIALHLTALAALYTLPNAAERRDRSITMGIWLTLLVLAAHLYFAAFPSFWNRIMLVSIPWQVATIFALDRVRHYGVFVRLALVATLSAVSTAALAYTLRKPESLPFTPYHSIVQVWLFDDLGTGRERSEQAISEWVEKHGTIARHSDCGRGAG